MHPGSAAELHQFQLRVLRTATAAHLRRIHADHQRAGSAAGLLQLGVVFAKGALHVGDGFAQILRQLSGQGRRFFDVAVGLAGHQMGAVKSGRQALLIDGDGGDIIQAQEGEVVEIFLAEFFAFQVGVHQAQAAQTSGPRTIELRDEDTAGIADHQMSDIAAAINQHAQLTANLAGQLAQGAGVFLGDDGVAAYSTIGQPL